MNFRLLLVDKGFHFTPAYTLYMYLHCMFTCVSLSLYICMYFQDVYECMLRNLFEEYRFFPQYPERELHTTAVLFGGIIEKGLAT